MRTVKLIATALLVFGVIGCTSSPISPHDRAALKRVYIAPIQLPEKPMVLREGSGALVFAGAIGVMGAVAASNTSDLPATYIQTLRENKIDLAAYIQTELIRQLSVKGIETVSDAKTADAVMTVEILQYGITGNVASSGRFPQLWAKFNLARQDGNVIWKNMGAAHISKEVAQEVKLYPLSDYFSDSKLLDSQINKVNQIIIKSVLETL